MFIYLFPMEWQRGPKFCWLLWNNIPTAAKMFGMSCCITLTRNFKWLKWTLFYQMGKQLESFKTSLEDFAGKYKQEIRKNQEFRGHFQQMCARIGVDPLACMSHHSLIMAFEMTEMMKTFLMLLVSFVLAINMFDQGILLVTIGPPSN